LDLRYNNIFMLPNIASSVYQRHKHKKVLLVSAL
jgi:hypothetical protein